MNDYQKLIKEIKSIIADVSKTLGNEINVNDLKFIFKKSGEDIPEPVKDHMYIYSFWHDDFDAPLKIGKASKTNAKRWRYSHYNPKRSKSTLAYSLINDNNMQTYGFNESDIKNWMLNELHRIYIAIPCKNDKSDYFTCELIESILHYKYRPIYEGGKF